MLTMHLHDLHLLPPPASSSRPAVETIPDLPMNDDQHWVLQSG